MSQGYKDCLKKVGNIWHYRFSVSGKTFRGSTKCNSRAEALKFVRDIRAVASTEGPSLVAANQSVLHSQDWVPLLAYTRVPAEPGSNIQSFNPKVNRRQPSPKGRQRRNEVPLNHSTLRAFLDAIDSLKGIPTQVVLAVRTMLFMGLRAHEVREMRWDQFDSALLTYTVYTDNIRCQHQLPVNEDMSLRFRDWKVLSQASWAARGAPMPDTVFWSQDGREHSLIRLKYWIGEATTSIGIPCPSSSHWLRMSCASLLNEFGMPCYLIRRLMRVAGHRWCPPHGLDEKTVAVLARAMVEARQATSTVATGG